MTQRGSSRIGPNAVPSFGDCYRRINYLRTRVVDAIFQIRFVVDRKNVVAKKAENRVVAIVLLGNRSERNLFATIMLAPHVWIVTFGNSRTRII